MDIILIPAFFVLTLFFLIISYLTKVKLEENNISAYSMMGPFWILNMRRLKRIMNRDPGARILYYASVITLILMGLIVLYFVFMIIISR